MEKTIQILIASTAFNCSEDAYAKLSSYLARLKAHFAHEADNEEIIRDIESRIAEKLLEQNNVFITSQDISAVIAEVGDVAEIDASKDETTDDTQNEARDTRVEKHLYRDPDNAYIAGVAGGIAAYFGISPILVRLVFLITLFFGGTGVIIYLLLWIVIPEAKTSTQKLQMHGKAVTLESISNVVKERIAESEESGAFKRTASFVRELIHNVFRFGAKVLGLFIAAGAFLATIALTIFLGIILTNWNAPYNDIPVRETSSATLLSTALVSAFIVALITLLFIFALGYRLLRNRTIIPATLGFALIGVWSLAVVGAAVSGAKIAGDFYTHRASDPAYEMITEAHEIDAIDRLVVNDANVQVQQGDAYQVHVEGRRNDTERTSFDTSDGILTITTAVHDDCLFCTYSAPTVIITVPTLSAIEVSDGSLTFRNYTDTQLTLTTEQSRIRGSLILDTFTLTAMNSRVDTELGVQELTINSNDSSLSFSGNAENATMTLQSTLLNADELVIQDATLSARDSFAELDVRGTLQEDRDQGSTIRNKVRTNNAH